MFSYRTNWKLATNRFTQTLEESRNAGIELVDLTLSNPTQCGLRYDERTILASFQNPKSLTYDPQPKGLLRARKEVAGYYLTDHGISIDPESIFLTTSTSEAYAFVFRLLCDPIDEVLVPKPGYPLFDFLGGLQDVVLVPYSLEYAQEWLIDFRSIEQAISERTRAILLVHPNNPTGSYVRPEEMARLNSICRERQIALIVDEVFLDYPFDGISHRSFAANDQALTFTLSGLSKISALPQMKVAWLLCTGPDELAREARERLEVIADTYLSLNAPTQFALPSLLEQRHSLQEQLAERIQTNRATLGRQVSSNTTCELLDARGGWYAVLRVPVTQSDEDLAIKMIREQGVITHPGHFFDFPKDGFLVVSLIPPIEVFREGIRRLLAGF